MKKLYVVGIGPGALDCMSERAQLILRASDCIAGYTGYIRLISPMLQDHQTIIESGMMGEVERCQEALKKANEGLIVSLVCSGDAGVYGMASLIFELSTDYPEVSIDIVAGITSACSGASKLGAPLSNDFCVLSLSDLLTPQELIDKRIEAAAMADFCCAIYNPMSKKRRNQLANMVDIFLQYRPHDTICGWVRNIDRADEERCICSLEALRMAELDMFTTVFIGNSNTILINGNMVTRRGYHQKYAW